MKTIILAAIRCSLMFTAVTASLFSVRPVQAFTVTLEQIGSNIVATGSGAINLTGLTFGGSGATTEALVSPSNGQIQTGPPSSGLLDLYTGFTGPASFGSGGVHLADTGSGDFVGLVFAGGFLEVPHGYMSGAALLDSMTFNNATLASLGVKSGTFEWTWGTGLPNQEFILQIGAVGGGVPDGGSTVSLLGCALLGLAALRRKLSC